MRHLLLPANIQFSFLLVMLALSAVAYAIALFALLLRRAMPGQVAPDRVTLFAIFLAAGKGVLESYAIAPFLQPSLTALCILACGYAIVRMLKIVIAARGYSLPERTRIDRWSVVLIPPIAGIALLALLDMTPDKRFSSVIDIFIAVNLIPAIYLIIQLPRTILLWSRG